VRAQERVQRAALQALLQAAQSRWGQARGPERPTHPSFFVALTTPCVPVWENM